MLVGLVPCKLGSTRLPRKNLLVWRERTLLEHTVEYLRGAGIERIYVTTEAPNDPALRQILAQYQGLTIVDPPHPNYCGIELPEVFLDVHNRILSLDSGWRYLVTSTCDNPIKPPLRPILDALEKSESVHEFLTFGKQGTKVGALHILHRDALNRGWVTGTARYGSFPEAVDVNSHDDWLYLQGAL